MVREGITGDSTSIGDGNEGRTVRHTIETDRERANEQLIDIVARLEGRPHDELPPLYTCIDDMVAKLFEDPPPAEAEAELAFNYAGYWIGLDHTGEVVLVERSSD